MLLPIVLAFLTLDLTPEAAPKLTVAWSFETGATSPNKQAARIAAFEATPVFADLFGGTLVETKLRAFSAADGRKLWETDLPFSAHSVSGTYFWKGKRYVVVCAGGHGKVDSSKLGSVVVAYRVP